MCGIAGFINQSKSLNAESVITAMTNSLKHRGPDDKDIWLDNESQIALGHRRLAILDLSPAGHQPMHSFNNRYVIVFNGEIYNFRELKKQLQIKKHTFCGHSDTEVILALISEYGLEAALQSMSGMFAFALWDKKAKLLHLARDRIGEKPLYYGMVNNSFVFASELKAICLFPDFNNPISREGINLFLQYGYIPAPHSIYQKIYKLQPGSYLTIQGSALNSHSPKCYWSATKVAEEGISNPLYLSDHEAILQAQTMLNDTVKSRMVSDVPIGAFLSGGIDSSLVTALMQQNSSDKVKTFTIGFHEKNYDEADYARKIAQHLQTDHTEFYVDASQALHVIPQLPTMYDEPFADSSAIPTYLVSKLTRQHTKVCLTGDGGDELFGGYNRYLLGNTLWKKIAPLPYPIRLAIRKLLLSISPTRWHKLLQFLQYPMLGDKLHKFASVVALKSPESIYQHLISQWHDTENLLFEHHHSTSLLYQIEEMDFIEKMMITDTISYLPDDIMVKVDRAGMAASLESRSPFLDHQLIEFIWKLPLNMKVRNHTTKWLLRQVLSKYVPLHLFERPKMGFGIPLDKWLRGPLREWAENLLNQRLIEQQGFLKPGPILTKWHEHLSGRRNWQYQIWTVLMFQAWITK